MKLGQKIASSASEGAELYPLVPEANKYPTGTADQIIEDVRRLHLLDPNKYITRNFYRAHGLYPERVWTSRFGTWKEVRREAGLELHRGAQRLEKAVAIHASRDRYRGFFEVEVLPWVGRYEKAQTPGMKRILIASDFHDKNADPFVLNVFLDTAERVQPDIIVLAGDVFDFAEFSRFDKDPRTINVKDQFQFVRDEIFAPLRQACPDAQIDMIIGNHDIRILRHMADRTPYLAPVLDLMGISLSSVFGLEKFEINLVSRGDFSAHQPKESRDEIKKNYAKYFDCLIVNHEPGDYGMCSVAGHTHKPRFESKVNELSGSYFNLTLGSICKIDLDYVQGLNKYVNGFALLHVDPVLKEIVPEQIIFTQNYATVGGKFYTRKEV